MDPHFLHVFPLNGVTCFLFENFDFILKLILERPLIFVLFLKNEEEKKKRNPKCDSYKGKADI